MVWAPECKYILVKLKNHLEVDHLFRVKIISSSTQMQHQSPFSKVLDAHSIADGDCGP